MRTASGKEWYDLLERVYTLATASTEKDIMALGRYLLKNLDPPAKSCEYALVAAAAVMVAVRNAGTRTVPDEKIRGALLRARRQAVTALCGVAPCGIASAVTTSFRVLLGTACPNSRAAVNTEIHTRMAEVMAAHGGGKDCKHYLWAALAEVPALAEKHLKINIPAAGGWTTPLNRL